jgi:holo-[acyl-carrier protein] synthase
MAEILGIGIDVVDIGRIADLRRKHGDDGLAHVVFRPEEVALCLARANPDECLAARFAAKEAVMKALGTGWAEGVAFTGIEIFREENGRPGVRLHGATLEKAQALGAGKIHLTFSHARDVAVAQALIEKAENVR